MIDILDILTHYGDLSDNYVIYKYDENNYKLIVRKVNRKKREGFKVNLIGDLGCLKEGSRFVTSVSRTKSRITDLALANDFRFFITLTLNGKKYNRYDLAAYKKDLSQFIRDSRKKYSFDIRYLLVPEKHKDGAVHVHGLIDLPIQALTINENGYLHWKDYYRKFGFNSLDRIRSKVKVSRYITKYVSKDLDVSSSELNLYIRSNNLKEKLLVKEGFMNPMAKIVNSFENDFVKVAFLSKNELKGVLKENGIEDEFLM